MFGSIREAFWIRGYTKIEGKPKTLWGDLIAIHPFGQDDPWGGWHSYYILKESNPIHQKWVTRNEYKGILKRYGQSATYVSYAISFPWKRYKTYFEKNGEFSKAFIEGHFGISVKDFWRNCKHGNYEHIKQLKKERRLAPSRFVPGVTKFDRGPQPVQTALFN